MLSRLIFAGFFLAVAVSGASGLEAMIGDAFVTLLPPAGFCILTPSYEFDGRTLAVVSAYRAGESIRLLAMSADCSQLAEAREGKRQVDDMSEYQIEIADIKTPPVLSIARKCAILRTVDGNSSHIDMNARIASILEKIKVNQAGSIGVVAEDENSCYTATFQKTLTDAGKVRLLVVLRAATIVRNKAIGVLRYAVYQDSGTINAVLTKLKSDVAAFVAKNP